MEPLNFAQEFIMTFSQRSTYGTPANFRPPHNRLSQAARRRRDRQMGGR